jgi:hypothetical protein
MINLCVLRASAVSYLFVSFAFFAVKYFFLCELRVIRAALPLWRYASLPRMAAAVQPKFLP